MRFPLLPTILVAAAVATMIALGFWQLRRADEKAALQRQYERNLVLPAMALPSAAAVDGTLLYRRASAFCVKVMYWRTTGGKTASGRGGTRFIADCSTGAEGPGFAADMGVSPDPKARPGWKGGEVTGRIVAEPPLSSGLMERLIGASPPPRPMIVSERAAPGLEASAPPVADAPNNSLAYAFQWFFFAAAAAVIYVLALRRRQREKLPPKA